jgi:hypothetical protein
LKIQFVYIKKSLEKEGGHKNKEFILTGELNQKHMSQGDVFLADGKVLIAGGLGGSKRMRGPIDFQIEERDFRYITNAELMVAYRPQWKGHCI